MTLSFKLTDSFIDTYANKPVDWGYQDAAGNSLGEITFLRTYSRIKPDGTKERWYEVCRRVIEWMYAEQKNHSKTNRLPWNDHKAQRSAQDAYDRMFHFKWTPPGRGLWVAGTPLVTEQRNSAPLQNCFRGSEQILTKNGVQSLAELDNQSVEVWADNRWVKAEIKSFGKQCVQRITFAPATSGRNNSWKPARSNHRIDVVATPDHRWILTDGTLTTSIKPGQYVPASAAGDQVLDLEGFRHGLIFADGSVSYRYKNGDISHIMRLCGAKERHKEHFEVIHYQPNCKGDPVVYHRSAENLKELPVGKDSAYLKSFIDGWLAGDGSHRPSSMALSTQDETAMQWLLEHAAIAGYVVTGHTVYTNDTTFGPRSHPLHNVILARPDNRAWVVKSIEKLPAKELVYCAVVPEVERFTLAGGIYTSNCSFISTGDMTKVDPASPFKFMMEALMLGVGVGFDDKGADKDFVIYEPGNKRTFIIPDTREGWVDSVGVLLESYLLPDKPTVDFDYSVIRPAGEPIRTFGGTAAGPGPLRELHEMIRAKFNGRAGSYLSRVDIADIGNQIGVCVVSGNVRRSAELLIGRIDDKDFINLKNPATFPERNHWSAEDDGKRGWAWMSNNSVEAAVGNSYNHIIDGIALNGEPGIIWMDTTRNYGRLIDPPNGKDWRVAGYNPCAEQSLESWECCTLVETYLNRHDSLEDFQRTLKFAYLYAKVVTLLPTHWEKTNAIMQRNRRIGCSVSGVANFADIHGLPELRTWLNSGYETVQRYDNVYSEWLGVRESIKTTTVKPSGTVSILAGESPGVHWAPGGEYFNRAIRLAKDDPMVPLLEDAGYTVEPDVRDHEHTVVAYFPIHTNAKRAEGDVTIFEKANLAVVAQRYWSDNSVSVTLSFDAEKEAQHVGTVIHMHEGQLKTVSFLPMGNTVYPQQPYTKISAQEWEDAVGTLGKINLDTIYDGAQAAEAVGEMYCTTDSCELKQDKLNS